MTDKEVDEHEHEHEVMENGDEGNAMKSKHERANAAELEKVTDFQEETDNIKAASKERLDSIINEAQVAKKKVTVKKEDIQLIVDELELPRARAERKLVEHDGDVALALKDLMGF
uniref:HYPK_UBA domain-containing protein n=1 Tax=Syphacia muris TaxID=451379 RepID=A0A0N5ADK9_9BILA